MTSTTSKSSIKDVAKPPTITEESVTEKEVEVKETSNTESKEVNGSAEGIFALWKFRKPSLELHVFWFIVQ